MSSETNKDLDYYLNLDWTLIEGTDLDFNGNPYYYIEIQYYNLFFNGPFSSNNYKGILNHLASLNKYAIDNILKDAICYGIN